MTKEAHVWNRNNSAWRELVDSATIGIDVSTKEKASFNVLGDLATLAGLDKTDGNIIVANGTDWTTKSGATARTSLGLGTGDTPQFSALELGHATENTLTASGGVLSIEGAPLAFRRPGVNAQTGTSYTLALSDEGGIVTMSNGSANTLTIPANATIALPVRSVINVVQIGAGVTTIEGASGVTVNGVSAGSAEIGDRYQGATLLKVDTNTWIVSGNVDEFA